MGHRRVNYTIQVMELKKEVRYTFGNIEEYTLEWIEK